MIFVGSNFVSLPYFIFKASMAIYVIGFFGWSLWYGQSRLSNGWKHALYLTHWGYLCFVIWATVDFVIVADRYRSQADAGHVKWFTKIPKNPLGKRNVLLINNSMSIQSTHSKQVLFISIYLNFNFCRIPVFVVHDKSCPSCGTLHLNCLFLHRVSPFKPV